MKRLVYITALLLTLVIVYAGGGVSIAHYCCARCETVHSCCDDVVGCAQCNKSHVCAPENGEDEAGCKETGCTATLYKIDLTKHAVDLTLTAPVIRLFCEQLAWLSAFECTENSVAYVCSTSSPPVCSRQRLALYSTYLI